MNDVQSPRTALTIQLPPGLIEELRTLAREKQLSVDEVVLEACLAYTEPYTWERCYKEWRRAHPNEPLREFGIDGDELSPPPAGGDRK
jgi:hypothetical protein